MLGTFAAGANLHANHINVGLDQRILRTPVEQVTSTRANVVNGAGYAQRMSRC